MVKNIMIRDMEEKDIYQMAELEQIVFSDPWSEESFRFALHNASDIYLIAEEEDIMLGYCGLRSIAGEGHIMNICVHPEFRGKGIGRMLAQMLIKRGREAGDGSFTLEVRKNNLRALTLYKKLGFIEAGIRKDYYNKPKDDAIIMWLY